MVRITKTMQAKHFETLSPWLKKYRDSACSIPLPLLAEHLKSFPSRWPFPRGDLYHWIPLLNRFDVILENFCKTYKLDEGPQTIDFTNKVLLASLADGEQDPNIQEGHGDEHLIESILYFSRMLLQNCGNRSLYASSALLNSLLNTTSLTLLEATLSFGIELAQRYQASLKRMNVHSKHHASLLQSHYNIDLDRVGQLAMPFAKKVTIQPEPTVPTTPATPTGKGKERAVSNQKVSTATVYANDLVSMVKGGSGIGSQLKGLRNGIDTSAPPAESNWEDWADVKLTYYPKVNGEAESTVISGTPRASPASVAPVTPTPVRRSSNLGPHGHRSSRVAMSEDSPSSRPSIIPAEEPQRPNFKTIEISSSKLKSAGIHALLQENITGLPQENQYELLTKLRVADALTSSLETRQKILGIRLLAITNLAYIHPETTFLEDTLKQDSDEPRRLQLASQLAELVHPPAEGDVAVPRDLQTFAFSALNGLAQHQSKYSDVCAALNTNVNHGVLLYVVRTAVAEMGKEDTGVHTTPEDEWRNALFGLISDLSVMPRTGGELVTAGLIPILVEIIGLRTAIARRYQPKVLQFLDNIMYSARDAFQTLVSSEGLDAVSNLIVFEVTTSAENAASGKGMPADQRSATVDYEIPFFQQQTLKWLFKFIHHMMTTAGGYGGNFDRLLRNLIDSSQLLTSLRQIISNANCFGSIVWTNAVSILNDFINNEPTSFVVIAEAGLSRALLEAVTCKPIVMSSDNKKVEPGVEQSDDAQDAPSPQTPPTADGDDSDEEQDQPAPRPSIDELQKVREGPLARGIMPTSDTISVIPQAFGAICLNNSGMKMFQASGALESFFEIFESPQHVKCMDTNKDLPANLGSTFDELVRHHPPLRKAIINAILNMVTRVSYLCKKKAEQQKLGAKLWTLDTSGKVIVADQNVANIAEQSSKGKRKVVNDDDDIEMLDADSTPADDSISPPTSDDSMIPYVAAVGTFLSAIFSNSSVRSDFSSQRGIEYVLELAESPCLTYNFGDGSTSRTLQSVIALLAEQKPHLTIPLLLRKAQEAADILAPFANYTGNEAFFQPFINRDAQRSASVDFLAQGTTYVKALVNIHCLVMALHSCFQNSAYNHRSANTSLNQLNFGDYYVVLVKSLGRLLGACFREDSYFDKSIPNSFKNSTHSKESLFSSDPELLDPEAVFPIVEVTDLEASSSEQVNGDLSAKPTTSPPKEDANSKSLINHDKESPEYKNWQTIRFLLGKIPRQAISPFFQILGKSLISKRATDGFQKQSHAAIADALAETILFELNSIGNNFTNEYARYWMGIIHILKDMLVDVSRHSERPNQTITLVLQAFKERGGFSTLNNFLGKAATVVQTTERPDATTYTESSGEILQFNMAVVGIRSILSLYSQLVNGKNVTEAVQTLAMTPRDGRDRTRPDYFSAPQFLVELRMSVLPTVRQLWESDLVEKAPSDVSEKLIDVIRTIANADSETSALRRSDKHVPIPKPPRKTFKINEEHIDTICDSKEDENQLSIAIEALYRCNNSLPYATEYYREVSSHIPRFNVPAGDLPTGLDPLSPTERHQVSDDHLDNSQDNIALPINQNIIQLSDSSTPPATGADLASSLLFDEDFSIDSETPASIPAAALEQPGAEEIEVKQVTVDDLDDERAVIRDNLIDKCLDVINAHGEVTFEVADLISTVVKKSPDSPTLRKVVAETLVIALMSFAGEDDLSKSGKKIAAYAHLLALLLRDKHFYEASVGELKDNLSTLLGFVKLSPNHSSEDPSPWIAHILLLVEMLLSEDSRPRAMKWTAPHSDEEAIQAPVLQPFEPAVPDNEQAQLLEGVLDILIRIGKDESLALSVLRILVILTRNRQVAQTMGEKKNIQRLFVMAKQLAGASSSRIQSPLMLILRHIIEDDETIKQIMRAEIKNYFENSKNQRHPMDVPTYLKVLSHISVRAPQLFVDVTNEMVMYSRWSYLGSEGSNMLVLKEPAPEPNLISSQPSDDTVQPTVQATEDLTLQDIKPSTEEEGVDTEMQDLPKAAPIEHKLPVVENPDGVIHFLLCELLNYKDVEDKEPAPALAGSSPNEKDVSTNGDVTMAGISLSSVSEAPVPKEEKTSKPNSKQEFKPDEHPIYIYRCFLLQCLTELLGSYNRTKIEFINFKRSAPPQPMTPSKPRSSVVNYLLFDLIPIGTLDSNMTISLQKKTATSTWAETLITALLAKTGEQPLIKDREPSDGDDEPDLLFVRRFVLENILKAYKEASTSTEPLDAKYARMYSLAELMEHIMNEKDKADNTVSSRDSLASRSQLQLRRLMFEKGFIAALTASIADVDLNFPAAKRAIKQILKPLRILTTTAVRLSDLALISATPGQGDEDEIESATSVSDIENEREETPDLFRNSTLGMFEPGRGDDSSSESEDDDEEMYEDGYGDEMEYEEEPEDDEDNISEEDEDIEGIGPIEGLSGDHNLEVEVVMDDDDDDDDEDDDDEESDSDDDSEDDDARVEIIDEAGNIQEIGGEEGMEDWEDDDGEDDDEEDDGEEEDYDGHTQDADEEQIHTMEAMMGGGGPLGELVRALGGGNPAAMEDMVERMEEEMQEEELERAEIEDEDAEERMGVEYMEDEEDEDDEGDDMDDEDIFLGQGYPGDAGPVAFGWEGEVDPPVTHRHRHAPRHAFGNPFPFFPGGRDPLGVPETFRYRSHRPGHPPPQPLSDGINPLLQRSGGPRRPEVHRATMGSWISTMGPPGAAELLDLTRGGGPFGTIGRNGGALQFHITTGSGHELPREVRTMLGLERGPRFESRREQLEPGSTFLTPLSTSARWTEEAKLLFGADLHEVSSILRTAIDSVLIPPYIEADKVKKAIEAERVRKQEEEAKKRAEEERLEKEAREAAEKIEREKKEAEEAEAAARLAAEALAERGEEAEKEEELNETAGDISEAMEGVEGGELPTESQPTEETPAEDRPRVTTVIRGNTMDITDLGIDADFLAELPEDLREEVIMSAVADRRSQAAATGAQPSEIDQEFLDALPEDIRDEIIQQERQERRRREREEQRRATAAAGGAPAPDMDAASILATLPPALRQQVLMEQDEEILNLLPRELAEQARATQRDHPTHHGRAHLGLARRSAPVIDVTRAPLGNQRQPRRPMVQMLDKSGIATLLRLMFTFQVTNLRISLNHVLENICQNRQNRIEVLGTLLSILQDGSIDMSAVERSFAQLSIRAKMPKEKDPKTPQPLKRTYTGMSSSVSMTQSISEGATPGLVVLQCLLALLDLTQKNLHVPAFFLTEHDIAGGMKRSLSRKGKGKENKAGKFALNSLLSLLDRDLIMESSQIMDSLSSLLSQITAPLHNLQRKQKEAEDAAKKAEAPSVPDTNASTTSPDATTANEQSTVPQEETSALVENSNYANVAQSPAAIGDASTSEPTKPETTEAATKEPEKKPRQLTPPVIPEQNLKLVINIFVARECSSKTFRDTLSTIKNLSAIPGAKAIFGRELIAKAQGLGEIILLDLEDLLPQIQKATTGTEIQGVALAKFSPGGSDQNKLLRVLTALDHLFDPKRDKTGSDSEGESSQLVEKQDLLSSLYENSTFGPMWEKLSACLSAIRQREHMLNVATILLPLIEALMVVCKNTTLKEAPSARQKEMLLTSPPPESRMESLFFTFTEEHRKILNDLVRHTPKLMSGTFSLLVKNPKVLEFDNKRNYFSRSIHSKVPNSRQAFPPLQLSVRRDQVFHDSFKSLYFQTGDQMKYGKLSIRFHGEEGVDAGGVTREWFQVLSRQMFDPGYALFIPVSSDRTTFHPNQLSSVNEEHLMFFKFIGRIIGKALYEGRVLDCHFSRAVYKRILGKAVSVKDMESLDPEYYKSLIWMLENDITDVITETFSVDNDKFGVVETIDFIENGRNVAVTQENKHEYVRLMVEWRLTGSVKEQLDEFLKGFHEIIPAELVAIFNEQELELLISGLPEIDVDDWKGNTEYHNYTASSPQIQWFWRAVRSYDKEERAKLLQFVTGTSKVPLNGFKELEGMNGFSRFNIHRDYGNKERLPSSHTCFNQLDLPEYESYEALRSHILTAITAGSEYFGFA